MGAARLFAALPLLLMAACTGQVVVPPVTTDFAAGGSPIAGSYAAVVQSGGWDLTTKTEGMGCGAWSFATHVDDSYADAMKATLTTVLQKVAFVPDALSPEQLQAQGYDGQVFLYQGNANASFGVRPGFLTVQVGSDVELTTLLAVVDTTGWRQQQSITGKGASLSPPAMMLACSEIGPVIGTAAQGAILDLAKDAGLNLRNDLLEHAAKTAATK